MDPWWTTDGHPPNSNGVIRALWTDVYNARGPTWPLRWEGSGVSPIHSPYYYC
mgnify:CR=1 FL=1